MGWLLTKKDPKVIEAGKKLDLSDLERDPVVMFQKRVDPWFSQTVCFVLPPLISYIFWNESLVAHYFVEVFRYVTVLHGTWLVNSAAHIYGDRPYDPVIGPRENAFVALCAAGEAERVFDLEADRPPPLEEDLPRNCLLNFFLCFW